MTATAELVITEPGVYDIPADQYHADPVPDGSLSASGAKLLLPPNCPAMYQHRKQNGNIKKKAFDHGHAAHKLVLGAGADLVVVDAADWRTKAAQAQRDAAYADGAVPLLTYDYERVSGMADALREHPIASALLNPAHGDPEQSLFWQDSRTGIWRRARLDWLPHQRPDGRLIIPDYKTCEHADLESIQRAVWDYSYHLQAAWYQEAAAALGLAKRPGFVFVFQEKTAPYLVTVVEPDRVALDWGRLLNRRAIDIYRRCVETGTWPAYTDEIELIALPGWAEKRLEEARDSGAFDA